MSVRRASHAEFALRRHHGKWPAGTPITVRGRVGGGEVAVVPTTGRPVVLHVLEENVRPLRAARP